MRTLSKHLIAALMGTALITSCSRPVAYFQPTAREQFTSVKPADAAVIANDVTISGEAVAETVPAEQVAQVKQAISQVEAYVRNDSKLSADKKLATRMARLNELVATANTKAVVTTNAASAKKMTFMERTVLKKLDKKIKNHVAPDQTNAMNSNVRLGVIVGIVGLLLLILGGGSVLGIIGLIGFIVGLVLVFAGRYQRVSLLRRLRCAVPIVYTSLQSRRRCFQFG